MGVDLAGPLYVKSGNGETKAFIGLFTCAITRAIYLEVVTDLTENSFLQAFRRFSSRSSLPVVMISDNVSTYLSSAETFQELFQSPSLKEVLGRQGTNDLHGKTRSSSWKIKINGSCHSVWKLQKI